MAEGARVAARHLPGHLVAGPRLAHGAGQRVDEDQRDLLAVGEVGDLPVAFDDARRWRSARGSRGAPRRPSGRGRRRRSPARRLIRGADRPRRRRRPARGDERDAERQRRARRPPARQRRSARARPARRRAASTARARRPASGPQPTKSSGPRLSPRVQGAVAAAAGVGDAAPVDRLVAGSQRDDEVAGVRRAERRRRRGQRVGVLLAAQDAVLDARPRARRAPRAAPSGAPRRSATAPPGRNAEPRCRAARPPPRLAVGIQQSRSVDAASSQQTRSTPSIATAASALSSPGARRQQVDVGGAAGRADRELRPLGAVVGGRQDRPVAAEQLGQRQAAVDVGLGVVGDEDQRVLVEEAVEAAGRLDQRGRSSRRPWRSTRRSPPGPWRCE